MLAVIMPMQPIFWQQRDSVPLIILIVAMRWPAAIRYIRPRAHNVEAPNTKTTIISAVFMLPFCFLKEKAVAVATDVPLKKAVTVALQYFKHFHKAIG
jgi:hypothetical protein